MLVPVRYPFESPSVATVEAAVDLASSLDDAHLYVLHVNVIHSGEDVDRAALQRGVESAVGALPNASYHVRDAFLFEEAILNEACHQDADYVVVGKSLRSGWRTLLAKRLGAGVDLEDFLRRQLDAELIVA